MSLDRFVEAQDRIWPAPLREITAGRKVSHWMWFVFPQLAVLGRSGTAKFYGIEGLAEAKAYLAHPVLGARLEQAAQAMLRHRGRAAADILGPVDAMKLRSSMTLFEAVEGATPVFGEVLGAFYGGERCGVTVRELERGALGL